MRPVWGRGRWHCLALGAACAAVTLVPLATEGGPADPGTTASLPHQLAGYSYLTADVSEAPPGRAIALYQHGFGVEFLDFPQAVVLGADTDTYRRLDAAEDRAGPETQGDPAPMLLSPDGRRVALGDHDTSEADLEIVDLSSADVARHALPPARSVRPVAWSSESTQVAYISSTEPTNPYSGRSLVGDLVVLDTDSGDTTAVTVGDPISGAAFSPDGSLIAVQRRGSSSGISLVDLATSTVRDLPRPLQDEAQGGVLAGPEAWSPDGRLLAVAHEESMAFLDVTGSRPQPPLHLTVPHPEYQSLVGWTDNRHVVLVDTHDDDTTRLVSHPLDGGRSQVITSVDGTSSYGVGTVQLASALLSDMEVRAAGTPDRGSIPELRLALAVLLGLAVTALAARLPRRRSRP